VVTKAYYAANREHCQRLSRESMRRRTARRVAVNYYQAIEYLGGQCLDCGYAQHLDALEFDHVPGRGEPEKRRCLATLWAFSWERIKAELNKCDLVCANCHRIRGKKRGQHKSLTRLSASARIG